MARPNAPWWRSARRQWYATIHGRKTPLGIYDQSDVVGAVEALNRLLGRAPEQPVSARVWAEVRRYEAEVVAHLGRQTRPGESAGPRDRLRLGPSDEGGREGGHGKFAGGENDPIVFHTEPLTPILSRRFVPTTFQQVQHR